MARYDTDARGTEEEENEDPIENADDADDEEEADGEEPKDEQESLSAESGIGSNVERLIRSVRINARRFILEACQGKDLKPRIGSIVTVCGRFPHPTPAKTQGGSIPFSPGDIDIKMLNKKCEDTRNNLRFMDTAFGFTLALKGGEGIRTVVTNDRGFVDIIFAESGTVYDLTRMYGSSMKWLMGEARNKPTEAHRRGRKARVYDESFNPDEKQEAITVPESGRILGDVEELLTPGSGAADDLETIVRRGIKVH